jgi:hypothetical protein
MTNQVTVRGRVGCLQLKGIVVPIKKIIIWAARDLEGGLSENQTIIQSASSK